MKILAFWLIAIASLIWIPIGVASADVNVGLSANENGISEFHFAVGEFYHVPQKEVVVVRERQIPDDQLPVVFFIADRAHVSPAAIVDMRLHGDSWMDISLHFGIGPDVYYVPVKEVDGPPYGKAYGYYKNKPRKEWNTIRLGDNDIVNLVDLKFVSEHYGIPPERVMRLRSDGDNFVKISNKAKAEKSGKASKESHSEHKAKSSSTTKHKGEVPNKGNGHKK